MGITHERKALLAEPTRSIPGHSGWVFVLCPILPPWTHSFFSIGHEHAVLSGGSAPLPPFSLLSPSLLASTPALPHRGVWKHSWTPQEVFELETQSQNLYAFFFLNSKRLFCVQTSKIWFKGLDSLRSIFWRPPSICIQYGPGFPNANTAFLAQQIKDEFLRTGKKLWKCSSPEAQRGKQGVWRQLTGQQWIRENLNFPLWSVDIFINGL